MSDDRNQRVKALREELHSIDKKILEVARQTEKFFLAAAGRPLLDLVKADIKYGKEMSNLYEERGKLAQKIADLLESRF